MRTVARFYAEIFRRGKTVKGTPDQNGIRVHVRGWNMGVEVTIFKNEEGNDEIVIRPTGGSKDPKPKDIVYENEYSDRKEQLLSTFKELRLRLPKKFRPNLNQHN